MSEETSSGDLATIARLDDGKGALQLSVAEYRAGAVPTIDKQTLEELRDDFARRRSLGKLLEASVTDNHMLVAAGNYRAEEDFVRVWYVSDRVNIALVTYVCQWRSRNEEVAVCERIVHSFRFGSGE